ncbi:hypothetical protein J2R96_008734 [Bradyrhizobium elkanii]|nr:hypothetical protein [Bradyrhizobium elkanii]
MESEQSLSLYYTGNVRPSNIEARDLIHVLSAFTRIAAKANRTYHGSGVKTSVRINLVQPGSIDLQWICEAGAAVQSAFPALPGLLLNVKDVASLVKAWLDLLKFLKGQPPQRIQNVQDGNALQIENASGQTTIVNGNVYNTFLLNGIGNDAQKLEIPTKNGAKKLELRVPVCGGECA